LSEGFVKVAESKDIEPSRMKAVDVAGEKVCIINIEGNYYVIGNICTHARGPLDKGILEGYKVKCPRHGSKFDVRTGEPTKSPARQAVPKYEVQIQDNNILVRKEDRIEERTRQPQQL
jgi:nitrite reductase/ring-hydroxylating ferredoxin subunit